MLDYLEGQLPNEGYLFGSFSLADLSIVSPFINASYAGYDIPADTWPKMAQLVASVRAEAPVAEILAKEAKALGFG